MFKRVLLPMVNYPFPTLPATIDQAVAVAQLLSAELSGLSLEMEPPLGLGYGTYTMPFVGTIIASEEVKASANKDAIITEFSEKAKTGRVPHTLVRKSCFQHEVSDLCVAAARFCDMSLLPTDNNASPDRSYAEDVIFGSGHPCLVLPQIHQIRLFQRAVIAWDGSRAAIRSIADAMSLLAGAAEVLVLTAAPDKTVAESETSELLGYLRRHGVSATWEVIDTGDLSPIEAMVARINNYRADFMVMGAFGHSRLRDFILGGFTKHMLAHSPLPVLMSY